MAWSEYSGPFSDSVLPVVTQLESMLTAHSAWVHVENVTEYYDQTEATSGLDYHIETYTCRIWKNKGTSNGTGKDFYLAIVTAVSFQPDAGQIVTGTHNNQGSVWLLGMESWSTTSHMGKHFVGYNLWTDTDKLATPVAPNYTLYPNTEEWHIVTASVSSDGLTYGNFGNPKHPIGGMPANPNKAYGIWDNFYYPCFGAADTNVENPTGSHPTAVFKALISVTSKGVFLWGGMYEDTDFTNIGYQYIGLGDESRRVDAFKTGFPLIAFNQYPSFAGNDIDLCGASRYPEMKGTAHRSFYIGTNDLFWMRFANPYVNRASAPYAGYTDFAAAPVIIRHGYVNVQNWYDYAEPGVTIPGMVSLTSGGPGVPFTLGDTITGPNGHVFKLFPRQPASWSPAWLAIDTEMT